MLSTPVLAFTPLPPTPHQFYARGLFASPLVTSWRGTPQRGRVDRVREAAWGLVTILHSLLDYPLRHISGELGDL